MVTIKDIARRAGVNPSVVSRALNNKYGVRKSTKERIIAIAEEMGYYPNTAARRLVTRKSGMIGVMMADISEPFYAQIIKGMEYVASKTGYTLLFSNSYDSLEQTDVLQKMIVAESVDGLVIVGSNTQDTNFTRTLLKQEIPFVLIERNLPQEKMNCIWIDNVEGAYLATRHLLEKGHKKIAHIAGNPQNQVTIERITGFKKAVSEFGLSEADCPVLYGNYVSQDGYREMKKILSRYAGCTGVFTANDSMAYGALHAIHEAALVVPKDIAVVGFDDLEFSAFTNPPLTTIRQPRYEMGKKSLEILTKILQGREKNGINLCLSFDLIIRNSA
ncbi:MAG TPA: LacI family transcriptional regulator [Firmicutes bacterium]|nr:LacI family transcriptional regulator [Bacillota bacterium]